MHHQSLLATVVFLIIIRLLKPRKDFLSPIKMGVDINYVRDVPVGDPETQPCRIIGKLANLQQISYSQISACLGDKVDEQVY